MKLNRNIFGRLLLIFSISLSIQYCEKDSENKMPDGVIVSGDSAFYPEALSRINDARNSIDECFPDLDSIPIILNVVKPIYPEEAKNAKIEGKIKVKAWIDEKGNPLLAVILESSNKLFNEQSLIATMNSSLKPAIKNNKPVGSWIIVPYEFKL
jgi:TonB family protein